MDYDGIANTILKGRANVHQAFLPEVFLGAVTDKPFSLNVEKAKFLLKEAGLEGGFKVTMDGKGRYLDNIFIERLWRSFKYEYVYLHAWNGGKKAREGIGKWINFYNTKRPHKVHCGLTPDVIYWNKLNNQPSDWSVKIVA